MKAKTYIAPDIRQIVIATGHLLGESLGRSETTVTNDSQVFSRRSSGWNEDDEQ